MDNIDPPPKELHIISYNLKNYDTHLIIQEQGAFDFIINFISNRFKKIYELQHQQ